VAATDASAGSRRIATICWALIRHSPAAYRNPAALPESAVVVVGSGQSGAQIAEDLHLAGRKVHLVTGNAPRCARFYRGRDVVDWLWDIGQDLGIGTPARRRTRRRVCRAGGTRPPTRRAANGEMKLAPDTRASAALSAPGQALDGGRMSGQFAALEISMARGWEMVGRAVCQYGGAASATGDGRPPTATETPV